MNQPLLLVPRTSVASKYLMAMTGLGLLGFVIIHMLGNLQVFLGPEALNSYATKLKSLPALLWAARLGLLVIVVLHIVYGIRLWLANRSARPIPYAFRRYRQATLASRTMIVTGLVVFAFVVFHLLHFTFGLLDRPPVHPASGGEAARSFLDLRDPQGHHDVYRMTIYGFRHPVMTLSYVAVMGFLFYHLSHGFQSLFQSLGLNDQRWMGRLQWISFALAVLIFIGNSSMPLAVLLGLVGGNL